VSKFLRNLADNLGRIDLKARNAPAPMRLNDTRTFGMDGVTMYPANDGNTYINKGYELNAIVHMVVALNAQKLAQIPFNHVRAKTGERKTFDEYRIHMKQHFSPMDIKSVVEAKKMRVKAIDTNIVDSELSKFLKKPNRYQSGSVWREQWFGYRQLTGEGNVWFSRGTDADGRQSTQNKPLEAFNIPKANLLLVAGSDAWDIREYIIDINGQRIPVPKENILMWKYVSYGLDATTMKHMRGMSPIEAGLPIIQASNEGIERLVIMNKNQGVAGLAYRKDPHKAPDPGTATGLQQAMHIRQQFNSIVNSKDVAGSIAYMSGEWGYLQFGLDAQQLNLLEQAQANMDMICNLLKTPPNLFKSNQTYDNVPEYEKKWIYSNIAPNALSAADELNSTLVPMFGLDRERDFVDPDVMALPELTADAAKQIQAVKDADFLDQDEKRIFCGWEPKGTPEYQQTYIATGKQSITQAMEGIGGGLDEEVSKLGDI
jgi:phage portal protein BeeE